MVRTGYTNPKYSISLPPDGKPSREEYEEHRRKRCAKIARLLEEHRSKQLAQGLGKQSDF